MRATVDVAGAAVGGAARFLRELDTYIRDETTAEITVIGRGRHLTPHWLAAREWGIPRGSLAIALNNASFVRPGVQRITLLRNALHFSTQDEWSSIGYRPDLHMRRQIPIIRALALRSDTLVVPSTAMADRVSRTIPRLGRRIVVRPHPVSRPIWAGREPIKRTILVPVVPGRHKPLEDLVERLARAVELLAESDVTITVTADPGALPRLERWSNVRFVGVLSSADLDEHWAASTAIYFPTSLESFGYPLAEARAGGRPVIALDTSQNREIAGPALHGFDGDLGHSLTDAVESALSVRTSPDPGPFNPTSYFRWLFGLDKA